MAGPWEKYQTPPTQPPAPEASGPWAAYQQPAASPYQADVAARATSAAVPPAYQASATDAAEDTPTEAEWSAMTPDQRRELAQRTYQNQPWYSRVLSSAFHELLGNEAAIRQAASHAMGTPEAQARTQAYVNSLRPSNEASSEGVTGVVGHALPYLAGGAGSATLRGLAAGGARAGGAMGMLSPVYTDEGQTLSTADYLRAKGVNTAADAIAGAVAAPVAKVGLERIVAPAVGKMVNTVRGVVDPALQEIQQLGQKYGVRLSTGDITQNALPKRAEVALESVPVVGTGGFRAAQQAEASTAAKGVADDMREAMINAPFKGIDQVEKAAADGNKVAIALKNELANAGDDWNKIVQASGNLQAFRTKQIADKLYGQVEQMAANAGNVPAFGTIRAIDEALAEATSSKLPDDSIISMLRKLKESMAGKKVDITDPVMIGSGEATQTVRMPDTDFSSMRKLRSDLGDMISDYYKGANAVTGSKGVGLLQRVRSGVEQDMQDFALNSGRDDLASAWRRADRFYRERVVPYKDRSLATALKDAPADEVFGRFIQAGKGERARNFYGALDPKGQAAVRYGMVANAMDKALDETRNVFSPAKFAGALDRIREAQGAFFRGDARREIDGFSKLMRHVERAGQFAENPPTGARTIPWLLGGAAAMNAPLAAKAAAVAGVAKALLTTAPGKRFLLASSKLEEGSPAMDKLLKRINQVMPKYSGISASDAVRNSQQPEVGDE